MNALIIEDDANVVEAISLCLQLRWPEVNISVTAEGTSGIEMIQSRSFDIMILDINLPDIDGFDVIKRIRSFSNVPIIILTVHESEDDQARGLEMGADDYVVKPFRPRDLSARVNSVLRRSRVSGATARQLSIIRGKMTLDLTTNNVQLGKETINMTSTECRLLLTLMSNAEQTMSGERIMHDVWGSGKKNTAILRTHIRRIRDKLKDKPPQIILSQRGGGYRFSSPT